MQLTIWVAHAITDTVSERLRRWTRNQLGSARKGLNPLGVALKLCSHQLHIWTIGAPPAGLEPAIFGLEVRRLVH